MKKVILPILVLVILLSSSLSVLSFGPYTHAKYCLEALDLPQDNEAKRIINAYPEAFLNGCEANDIAVVMYYTSYKDYKTTHAWAYCDSIIRKSTTDADKSFGYGCKAHLAADSVSHNFFVPNALKRYKIFSNDFLHPLVEEKLDIIYSKDGSIQAIANNMLGTPDPYDPGEYLDTAANIDNYVPIMSQATGWDPGRVQTLASTLRVAVSEANFYRDGFSFPILGLVFRGYKVVATVITPLIAIGETQTLEVMAKERIQLTLEGQDPVQLEPHGTTELRNAEVGWRVLVWIAVVAVFALIVWFGRRYLMNKGLTSAVSTLVSVLTGSVVSYYIYTYSFIALVVVLIALFVWGIVYFFYWLYFKPRRQKSNGRIPLR